jgi:putative membrane protein insertion efficiency factor
VTGPGADGTTSWAARPFVALVRGYQRWISPALPPTCRFFPSCSAYAVEALQVHGLLRGAALTVWRLLRCAPWHPGGVDPVPPAHTPRTSFPDGPPAGPRTRSAENHEEQAPC